MSTSKKAPKVINWSSAEADGYWDWDRYPSEGIRKVVIGPGPGAVKDPLVLIEEQAAAWVERIKGMPAMTHLYLWNVHGLTRLPSLPPGLKCLDVRGCAGLREIPHIPQVVETLVVERCENLVRWPEPTAMGALVALRELRIQDIPGCLRDAWFKDVLDGCKELETLDLSGSTGLTRLDNWGPRLRRVILNECRALRNLPRGWPATLYRVELAGTAVHHMPAPTKNIDYLNLAGARSLRELHRGWSQQREPDVWRPRTLYLHGSGILVPPVSEHGESDTDNVAASTRGYFEDIRTVGESEVRRCKVLMLGNGRAGKTSLSLVLQGEDARKAQDMGSTHGILFWMRGMEANGSSQPYDRHIWDFGGQDIYHNAHRLFVSAGAVFVVLWDPEQDGQEAPVDERGYRDLWRPLRYWLDYIRMACPYNPRILVVCNRRQGSPLTPEEIRKRFQEQVKDFAPEVDLKIVNLWERTPGLQGITLANGLDSLTKVEEWVDNAIQQVIEVQGTRVPSHWSIAEKMVSGWLRADAGKSKAASVPNQMTVEDFKTRLEAAMSEAVAGPMLSGEGEALADALQRPGGFELTPDRLRRTLSFLSHVGLVFWHHRMYRERVIIRQQWALEAVYSLLDRRESSPVYHRLGGELRGRFTLKELVVMDEQSQVHSWVERYPQDERSLLLSLMVRMGVCFPLVPEERSYWGEALYVSVAHLPSDAAARRQAGTDSLRARFESTRSGEAPETRSLRSESLHEGRWFAVLAHLGSVYGREGQYARDAFLLEANKENQAVLVEVELTDPKRLGGSVTLHVLGAGADELADKLKTSIESLLEGKNVSHDPKPGDARREDPSGAFIAGGRRDTPKVFISYARDEPEDASQSSAIRRPRNRDYTSPVRTLETWAKEALPNVHWMRDEHDVELGQSITRFFTEGLEKADKVLVVHSDRYWLSPYCMYEITQARRRAGIDGKPWGHLFLMVELETSGVWDSRMQQDQQIYVASEYATTWNEWRGGLPVLLKGLTEYASLRDDAAAFLRNDLATLRSQSGIHWDWKGGDSDGFKSWLRSWFVPERAC